MHLTNLNTFISTSPNRERLRGADSYDGSGAIVALGFILLLIDPLVWRMYCEMLILNFRIHSTLTDIYHKVDRLGEKKDVTETKG